MNHSTFYGLLFALAGTVTLGQGAEAEQGGVPEGWVAQDPQEEASGQEIEIVVGPQAGDECQHTMKSFQTLLGLDEDAKAAFFEELGNPNCVELITAGMFQVPLDNEDAKEALLQIVEGLVKRDGNGIPLAQYIPLRALRGVSEKLCQKINAIRWFNFVTNLRSDQWSMLPRECLPLQFQPDYNCQYTNKSFAAVHALTSNNGEALVAFILELKNPKCVRQITADMFQVPAEVEGAMDGFLRVLLTLATPDLGSLPIARQITPETLANIPPPLCQALEGDVWLFNFVTNLRSDQWSRLPRECLPPQFQPDYVCLHTNKSFVAVFELMNSGNEGDRLAFILELKNPKCVRQITADMFQVPAEVEGAMDGFLGILKLLTAPDAGNLPIARQITPEALGNIQPAWCEAFKEHKLWARVVRGLKPDQQGALKGACKPVEEGAVEFLEPAPLHEAVKNPLDVPEFQVEIAEQFEGASECLYTMKSFNEVSVLKDDAGGIFLKELRKPACVAKIEAHMFDVPADAGGDTVSTFNAILAVLLGGDYIGEDNKAFFVDEGLASTVKSIRTEVIRDIRSKWCMVFHNSPQWRNFFGAVSPEQRNELSLACRVGDEDLYLPLDPCFYARKAFDELFDLITNDERAAERADDAVGAFLRALGNSDCVAQIRPQMFNVPDGTNDNMARLFSSIIGELRGQGTVRHPSTVHSLQPEMIEAIPAQSCYSFRDNMAWDDLVLEMNDRQMAEVCMPCLLNNDDRLLRKIYAKGLLHKFTDMMPRIPNLLANFQERGKFGLNLAHFIDRQTFEKAYVIPKKCGKISPELFAVLGTRVVDSNDHPFKAMNSRCLSDIPAGHWDDQGEKVKYLRFTAFSGDVTEPLSNVIYEEISDGQFQAFVSNHKNCQLLSVASLPLEKFKLIPLECMVEIPHESWAKWRTGVQQLSPDIFRGIVHQPLLDVVYQNMNVSQFEEFQWDPRNCEHVKPEFLQKECLEAMTYECLKTIPNDRWEIRSEKVEHLPPKVFTTVDTGLEDKDRVYANMSDEQYDQFFNLDANLKHLSIEHAPEHIIKWINTPVQLLATSDKWAGQSRWVHLLPDDAFKGKFDRPLHDDIYRGMQDSQFKVFISEPDNCKQLKVSVMNPGANFHMPSQCLQDALKAHPPASAKSFIPGFYQLLDNAGIFEKVELLSSSGLPLQVMLLMQQDQITQVVKKLVESKTPLTAGPKSIAQAIANAQVQVRSTCLSVKKSSELEKYPWQLFNSEAALQKLGPTLLKSLNKPLDRELFKRKSSRET